MKMTQKLVFMLLPFLLLCKGSGIQGAGDFDFKRFLSRSMLNYRSWLKENNLDPSPPITDILTLNARTNEPINLQCNLSNTFLSGHSDSKDIVGSSSNFDVHVFSVTREILQTFNLNGDFNCSGAIKRLFNPELENDLPFIGQGKYLITVQNATEILEFENVGITSDYILDMTHSWSSFAVVGDVKNTRLKADWSEKLINSKYIDVVQRVFGYVFYFEFLFFNTNQVYPSRQLLESYLREKTENLNLSSIIPQEKLPPIYTPTPSTTESTNPPTTVTTVQTNPPTTVTTVQTNPPTTTTTEQTSPGAGTKVVLETWVFFLQAIFMFHLIR